jgi:hypothetical protein
LANQVTSVATLCRRQLSDEIAARYHPAIGIMRISEEITFLMDFPALASKRVSPAKGDCDVSVKIFVDGFPGARHGRAH